MVQSVRWARIFGDRVDPRVRIEEAFGGSAANPQVAAGRWANETLKAKGLDPRAEDGRSQIAAIAALRAAKPELTLKTVAYLVKTGRWRA
ncbi:hypothetical protein [Arthrobacter jinronghuae]|uniref:hypothetical protein n=1 Tax=Arthrobacter jinronghuae TaxID=2964609 RepID=UPI0021AFFD8E|nr:hypothetical protein [Arthrobacter jinronghuae]UWX78357.1 hypothetical protein N2K98_15570 [Arthrobacter jinronghuae]